jgi:hypothetical protein
MAVAANTFLTFDSRRNREEFSNAIHMITPEETPALTLLGRENVESTHPEWSTDTLATPDTGNAFPQGDEFTYDAITPTTRLGNYTQISRKSYVVSRTQEKTLKAGPKSELGRERRKKGVELKKDMEAIVLTNQASTVGSANVAGKLGGLPSWLTSNDNRGSGGSDGGFSSGTGLTVAATNGTQRAFTKVIMDDIILKAYNSGGNPTTLLVSPYVKTVFSTFMDDADVVPLRKQASGGQQTIYGAADAYQSNFGMIDVVPNRVMANSAALARNAFLLDPDYAAVGIFDDIMEKKPAITGDAEKRVLIVEYTFLMKNEAAHGIAADLFGLSAST